MSATILYRYGQALWRWGDTAEAEEKLRAALSRRASFIAPRLTLAALLNANGQTHEAHVEYGRCVDLAPAGAEASLDAALDLLRRGEHDLAIAKARHALDLEATEASPTVVRAFLTYLHVRERGGLSSGETLPPAPTGGAASQTASTHAATSSHLTPPVVPIAADGASLPSGARHIFHAPTHPPATGIVNETQTQAEPQTPLRVAAISTATTLNAEPPDADLPGESSATQEDAQSGHKQRKRRSPKIPKAERTKRASWLARLFHWGR